MVGRRGLRPTRIVDTRTGSGRFLAAAADRFPQANLVAVESDPVAALMLRATAATRGFEERLSVKVTDYRRIRLPGIEGRTLFIGNPPYVRHHDITARSRLPGKRRNARTRPSGLPAPATVHSAVAGSIA